MDMEKASVRQSQFPRGQQRPAAGKAASAVETKRAKQSQFRPSDLKGQVLCGKRVMMNWACQGPRGNKANLQGQTGGLFLKSHGESGKSRSSEVCGLCFGSMRTLSAPSTGRGVVMSGIRPQRQPHTTRALPFHTLGMCNRCRQWPRPAACVSHSVGV